MIKQKVFQKLTRFTFYNIFAFSFFVSFPANSFAISKPQAGYCNGLYGYGGTVEWVDRGAGLAPVIEPDPNPYEEWNIMSSLECWYDYSSIKEFCSPGKVVIEDIELSGNEQGDSCSVIFSCCFSSEAELNEQSEREPFAGWH